MARDWLTLCLWASFLVLCCYASAARSHGKAQEPQNGLNMPPFAQQTGDKKYDDKDADSSRLSVLLVPFAFPGHLIPMAALGEELTRRGHNVTLYSAM